MIPRPKWNCTTKCTFNPKWTLLQNGFDPKLILDGITYDQKWNYDPKWNHDPKLFFFQNEIMIQNGISSKIDLKWNYDPIWNLIQN